VVSHHRGTLVSRNVPGQQTSGSWAMKYLQTVAMAAVLMLLSSAAFAATT
jgi:hypothetical protein